MNNFIYIVSREKNIYKIFLWKNKNKTLFNRKIKVANKLNLIGLKLQKILKIWILKKIYLEEFMVIIQ